MSYTTDFWPSVVTITCLAVIQVVSLVIVERGSNSEDKGGEYSRSLERKDASGEV